GAIGRAVSQARSGIKVLLGFYDGFDFHRRVHGQDRNPDRRPGMFTTLAQGGNQEIGSAIGHEMLFYIIGSRSDENGYLDDAAQIAEAAKGVAYLRKHIDGAPFGGKLAGFRSKFAPEQPHRHELAILQR